MVPAAALTIFCLSSSQMEVRRKITKGRTVMKKLGVEKLKQKSARDDLVAALAEKLDQPLCSSAEECWDKFKTAVYDTAKEQLGYEDWFDENDEQLSNLIEAWNRARVKVLTMNTRSVKAELRKHSNLLQKRCRQLKNVWWTDKAAELQQLADLNDTKGFYENMQGIWGPRVNHRDQLLPSDNSTLLTEKQHLLDR